jgi:hypothetical protein
MIEIFTHLNTLESTFLSSCLIASDDLPAALLFPLAIECTDVLE